MEEDAASRVLEKRIEELALRILDRTPKSINELAAGLGHRRFFRLELAGGTTPHSLVARVEGAPPASSDPLIPEPKLEPIRSFLAAAGLPVPRSYGLDGNIQLLEDLGDQNLKSLAARADASERFRLYGEACSLIPRLQRLTASSSGGPAAFGRRWGRPVVASKARKWLDWSFPVFTGRPPEPAEQIAITNAFDFVARTCEREPLRLAHRDFQATNLHWSVDPATGAHRLAMIDLQGAFLAPPEYDLVCLLRDAHVPLPEHEVQAHLARVRASLPDCPSEQSFSRRFDLVTLTRVSKDVSHYLAASSERGDHRYLRQIPYAMEFLRAAAGRARTRDPEIAPLAGVIERAPSNPQPPQFPEERR